MLEALQSAGARAAGVEPYGFEYLRLRGFEVYQTLSEAPGDWDRVVMIDVFEHLDKPWEVLAHLRELLADGGWIYVATANPVGLNARINKGKWREARKQTHLLFPHPTTMEQMLSQVGFRQIKRLHWLIRYHRNPVRTLFNYAMQLIGLDGELRYLAWR